MLFRKNDSDDLFSKLKDDNNDNGDSNPSRSTRALRIQKRKSTLSFFFFYHRILVEAAHVRKILLVKLVLLQKDTVVFVHKDSGERIVTKVF